MVQILVEIVICCLALLGIYSAVHWIARRFFGSRRTVLAIEILTQRDADSAELLIRDALFSALGLPSGRLVVLTKKELLEEESFRKILKRYGADFYCVLENEEG